MMTSQIQRLAGTALLLLALSPGVLAHKTQPFGPYRVTIGWADEPAFTGSRNFIVVSVADTAGTPVADPGASLVVEVAFGSERIVLSLQPDGARRGEFKAALVPTRPGTYTFHVTGKVKDQTIDLKAACSDTTFDCVTDASAIQFPSKDPSAGELADRINRSLPRAERALDTAARAQTLAIAAVGVAALAFVAAIGFARRRGAKGV
jgi:hypothetical protein